MSPFSEKVRRALAHKNLAQGAVKQQGTESLTGLFEVAPEQVAAVVDTVWS